MLAYFDIQNFISYVKSHDRDCDRMLKGIDVQFNFTKDELKERAKDNPEILSWVTTMTDGVKGNRSYNGDRVFPSRPLKGNTHISFDRDQLSAVYLIDDERVETIKNQGSILCVGVGEEVYALSSLFNEDNQYDDMLDVGEMKAWDDIQPYVLPVTDIIISDRYLFSVDERTYQSNLYSMLSVLCSKVKNATVHIVIFTLPRCRDSKNKTDYIPNWNQIKADIKSKIKARVGQMPQVTFVLSSELEHDRTVFTNYRFYNSGDSLNLFGPGKVISSGRYFHIKSMAKRGTYDIMMKFISDMQDKIDEVRNRNADYIKGDKKSLYLHF